MKIVIIGGSFAGISCALQAKRLYPTATVQVIDQQANVGFIPSGLNLKLNEEIEQLSQAYFMSERDILKSGVQLTLQQKVTAIDVETQKVTVQSVVNDATTEYTYDKLVLAMGSKQSSTLVEHLNDARIVSTKQFECAEYADRIIEQAQHVAVIGGGQIGMEASEALVNANKQVTLIEAQPTLAARYFDLEFVSEIQQAIELVGVDLRLGECVTAIHNEPLHIETAQSDIYPDAIVLGVNLIPNSELVADIVTLNTDKTVKVDEFLQTSVENVYAIGDLIQTPYGQTEERFIALVNNAIRSGQAAAFNLSSHRVKRPHSLRTIGSRVFSQYIVSVGMTEAEAANTIDQVQSVTVIAPYALTDETEVHLKLVVNPLTGQLLGAQLRSEQNILSFADVLALAIGQKLTDEQLAFQDRLYYPNETAAYPILFQAALRSFEARQA